MLDGRFGWNIVSSAEDRAAQNFGLDAMPEHGTPSQVSEQMGEVMEEIGGDGFLITRPGHYLSREYISSITDGLVPELQRRGLARKAYTQRTLRKTLREF